jgi:GTP-binding protein
MTEPRAAAPDPLVVRSVEFLGGMASPGGWRPDEGLPELAFAGRSNVGKSSLINRLLRRKAVARVSQTPGKTREINFFRVNDRFLLADLPGYGFARVSKSMRATWAELIDGYLRHARDLRGVVQLVDARHDPTPDDLRMLDFLGDVGVPTLVCLTKMDKVRAAERAARPEAMAVKLQLDPSQLIPFSSVTGQGRDDLAEAIVQLVEGPSWRDA